MDLSDSPDQARYRETVRAWLAAHRDAAPPASGSNEDEAYIAARRRWQGELAEGGLAGVAWPQEYGGQGLGPIEHVIVNQEISAAGVPGILDTIGVGMLGPTIIAHGTDAQKARHLGPMLHGDEVWCQLFSEPAAVSSWLTTTWLSGPRPWPPYAFGHVTPLSPASVSFACQARRASM